jgi:hypothetical protein
MLQAMAKTKLYKIGQRYGDVERSLMRVFRLDESQRGAFRGRLKHFQRLGLPELEPGKGKKIAYTRELVFQWLIALLLAQLGIDPVLIVAAIKSQWRQTLAPAIEDATKYQAQEGNHVYLALRPRLMSGALGEGAGLEITPFNRFATAGSDRDNLPYEADKEIAGVKTWFCVIDLTSFALQIDVMLPRS